MERLQQGQQAGREIRLGAAGAPVQGADPAEAADREVCGDQRIRGQGEEQLVLVPDPPELGAGRVDEPLVGQQPLLVEGLAEHPYGVGAGARVVGETGRGRRPLPGQGGRPGVGSTAAARAEQPLPLGAFGAGQGGPAGAQGRRIGCGHPVPAQAQAAHGPGHQIIEQRYVIAHAADGSDGIRWPGCVQAGELGSLYTHSYGFDRGG